MERQVYVARDKMDALNCMELSPEDQALLTTDHEATNIHAVLDIVFLNLDFS